MPGRLRLSRCTRAPTSSGAGRTEGIEVLDPAHDDYRLVIDESSLRIYTDYESGDPVVTTDARSGIDAASITFGSARGGHNLVQNSSFEMGAFGGQRHHATTVGRDG